MAGSRSAAFIHFVWTTKNRAPLICPEIERDVYRIIRGEARKLRCHVLALNGTADHVHVLARFPRTVSFARFVNQVKGVTSRHIIERSAEGTVFQWQEGYGVFSVSSSDVEKVTAYIDRQKQRHAAEKLWPSLEGTDIE